MSNPQRPQVKLFGNLTKHFWMARFLHNWSFNLAVPRRRISYELTVSRHWPYPCRVKIWPWGLH